MPSYLVTWKIYVEADDEEGAARVAQTIQRDHSSTATVFLVEQRGACKATMIALQPVGPVAQVTPGRYRCRDGSVTEVWGGENGYRSSDGWGFSAAVRADSGFVMGMEEPHKHDLMEKLP